MTKERIPIKTQRLLETCSLDELQFFASIANKKDFPRFIDYVKRLMDNEKNYIFGLSEAEPQKLAIEKAFSRGTVAGLENLVYTLKGAVLELEKRLENK